MTMIRSHRKRFHIMFFLFLAMVLIIPTAGMALTECPTPIDVLCTAPGDADCDQDGFTDAEECGVTIRTNGGQVIYGYASTEADKLDPSQPDLFYLVSGIDLKDLTATDPFGEPSLLYPVLDNNPNALKFYTNSDLRVRTHRIPESYCGTNRSLTSTVRAARIMEDLSLTTERAYIGSTPQSTPVDRLAKSTIYTKKIKEFVNDKCRTGDQAGERCAIKNTSITNLNGTDNTPIIDYYILQVISHEMGHGSKLAPTNARTNYHYSKSGTIMDPAASFRKGLFVISTGFDPVNDPPALTLK